MKYSGTLKSQLQMLVRAGMVSLVVFVGANITHAETPQDAPQQEPIVITARDGVIIDDKAQTVHATQDVSVERGAVVLYGNIGTGEYVLNPETKKRDIKHLKMAQDVLIFSANGTIYGDHGTYDIERDTITLTGENLRMLGVTGDLYAKDRLVHHPEQRVMEAHGEAKVFNPQENQYLFADTVIAHFKKQAQDTNRPRTPKEPSQKSSIPQDLEIQTIDALKNVRIVVPDKVATADKALYDAKTNVFTLSGNVVIQEKDKVLHGNYAVINRTTGHSTMLPWDPTAPQPAGSAPEPRRVKALLLNQKTK